MKRSLHSLSSNSGGPNSGGPNSGRRRKQTNHNNSFQSQRPKSSHGRASHPRSNNTTANSILSNIRYDKSVRLEEPASPHTSLLTSWTVLLYSSPIDDAACMCDFGAGSYELAFETFFLRLAASSLIVTPYRSRGLSHKKTIDL